MPQTRNEYLSQLRTSWDASAKTTSRVKAVHFCENGQPLAETVYDDIFAYIDRYLEFRDSDCVIEIGAGSGLVLERIARHVRKAVGVDLSLDQLMLMPEMPNVERFAMESQSLKFPDATFDKVVCKGVFQYFPDDEYAKTTLSEMLRVCRPGGKIFVGDIFNGYLYPLFEQLAQQPRVRPLAMLRTWLKHGLLRRPKRRYHSVAPEVIVEWLKDLGCTQAMPLVPICRPSPLLFKMFRFDLVIEK